MFGAVDGCLWVFNGLKKLWCRAPVQLVGLRGVKPGLHTQS